MIFIICMESSWSRFLQQYFLNEQAKPILILSATKTGSSASLRNLSKSLIQLCTIILLQFPNKNKILSKINSL